MVSSSLNLLLFRDPIHRFFEYFIESVVDFIEVGGAQVVQNDLGVFVVDFVKGRRASGDDFLDDPSNFMGSKIFQFFVEFHF